MPIEDKAKMTLDDLKTIIQGLKMSTLSFVEDDAINNIKERIKNLPSSEKIDGLRPRSLKIIRDEIGEIMKLIDIYSRRDMEFKSRYKSRTGLPPRYKVMDFVKQQSMEIVKEVIKISSCVDNDGRGELAGNLIKFAKKIQNDNIEEKEWKDMIDELKNCGYCSMANNLEKSAQTGGLWSGVMKGIGNVTKQFMDPIRLNQTINTISKSMNSISYYIDNALSQVVGVEDKIGDQSTKQQIYNFKNLMLKLKESVLGARIKFNYIQKGLGGSDASFDDMVGSGQKYKITKGTIENPEKINFVGLDYDVKIDTEGSFYIQSSDGQKYELMDDYTLEKASLPTTTSTVPVSTPSSAATPSTTPSSTTPTTAPATSPGTTATFYSS